MVFIDIPMNFVPYMLGGTLYFHPINLHLQTLVHQQALLVPDFRTTG